MKKLFIYILFSGLFIWGLYSCDATTSHDDILSTPPSIRSLDISPSEIEFSNSEDGFKDTTVTVELTVDTDHNVNKVNPKFFLTDKISEEILVQGEMDFLESTRFQKLISLETNTTAFEHFLVNVLISDEQGRGNYAQGQISITGVSNNAPEILEVNNPDEYQLPSSGSENIPFTAKVTDLDGQNTISGVYLRLISRTTGEATNSPFQLFDDGSSLGDEVAQDSIYTLTFPISSSNQPDTYDILYYAEDKGGLVSDTVETTFRIVE